MEKYRIRQYREKDEIAINIFFKKAFGGDRYLQRWHWLYQKNSAGKPVIFIIEDENGNVVGQSANIAVRVKFLEEEILAYQSIDSMVDPNHRGRGLFTKAAQEVLKFLQNKQKTLIYHFPNENSFPIYLKSLSRKEVTNIPILVKLINHKRSILIFLFKKYIFGKFKNRLILNIVIILLLVMVKMIDLFSKNPEKILKANSLYKISLEENIDERFNRLWEDLKKEYSCIVVRDKIYLRWRYIENPMVCYHLFTVAEENKLNGYVVVRIIQKEKARIGVIVDLFCEKKQKVIDLLIANTINFFKQNNVDVITLWMLDKKIYKSFKKFGFIPFNKIHFTVWTNMQGYSYDAIFNKNSWYINWGDADTI